MTVHLQNNYNGDNNRVIININKPHLQNYSTIPYTIAHTQAYIYIVYYHRYIYYYYKTQL